MQHALQWLGDRELRLRDSRALDALKAVMQSEASAPATSSAPNDGAAVSRALVELIDQVIRAGRFSIEHTAENAGLNRAMARLVLDGVLAIPTERGTSTGFDALSEIFDIRGAWLRPSWSGAALGADAMALAAAQRRASASELARTLYFHHRRAVTPAWRDRLATTRHVMEFLGVSPERERGAALRHFWTQRASSNGSDDWIHWTSRTPSTLLPAGRTTFKLYLSPVLESLRAALGPIVDVFAAHGVSQFKIGGGCYALMRPDYFVAYFSSIEALNACARDVVLTVGAFDVHGVPFTAPIVDTGCLSWGIDFVDVLTGAQANRQTSWRAWLCQRLGQTIFAAQRCDRLSVPVWEAALIRLSLDDVDPMSFAPSAEMLRTLTRE
jgi:hypothetical protein